MTEPLRITVVRYQCPHCPTRRANKGDARAHLARCWFNPAARSCKTCGHYTDIPDGPPCVPGQRCSCNDGYEGCDAGVDISRRFPNNCPKWLPLAVPTPTDPTTTTPTTKD